MAIKVNTLELGPLLTNCYIVSDTLSSDAVCVDPASEAEQVIAFLHLNKLNLKAILLTHGHGDHIGGVAGVKAAYDVPVIIHAADAEMLKCSTLNLSIMLGADITAPAADKYPQDRECLVCGSLELLVLFTPGHTPGGISFFIAGDTNILLSGDTLFDHEVGRCDFPRGNFATLQHSIRTQLFTLPDDTLVFPGHGSSTTIGVEKAENPYLKM